MPEFEDDKDDMEKQDHQDCQVSQHLIGTEEMNKMLLFSNLLFST